MPRTWDSARGALPYGDKSPHPAGPSGPGSGASVKLCSGVDTSPCCTGDLGQGRFAGKQCPGDSLGWTMDLAPGSHGLWGLDMMAWDAGPGPLMKSEAVGHN